ncbi:DUF6415 family natural product biosynthesis protein [Streptomyces sp. NPDC048211]|uniref:DUF6415 family natural product biosynthesis protein n=1 Tax=Streptomyces sp. NPDC048211 TaxID=3365516 RepID=UPI003717049B
MVPHEAHEPPILDSVVPERVDVLALVGRALSWGPASADFPTVEEALELAKGFTTYGRIVADDLSIVIAGIPSDSPVGRRAQATLDEASRRLTLKPLGLTVAPRSAAHRAQNLARLVQALSRVADHIGEAQVRPRPEVTRHREAVSSARAPSAERSAARRSP